MCSADNFADSADWEVGSAFNFAWNAKQHKKYRIVTVDPIVRRLGKRP